MRARRADAARDEDLDVVGAAPEVLARAAADLVHAVVAGQRPPVAVVRGETSSRHEEPRPGDDARLDGVAQLDVEEVLLAHHPHRGRAGGEVAFEVPAWRPAPGAPAAAAELAELVAEAGHDRGVAVAVDEPGHDEAIAEIERLRAGRCRRGRGGPDGGDAPVGDHDRCVARAARRPCRRTACRSGSAGLGPSGPHVDWRSATGAPLTGHRARQHVLPSDRPSRAPQRGAERSAP